MYMCLLREINNYYYLFKSVTLRQIDRPSNFRIYDINMNGLPIKKDKLNNK